MADNVTLVGVGTTFSPGTDLTTYTWNTTSPYPNVFFYDQSLVKSGNITSNGTSLQGQSLNNAQFGWETPTATTDALGVGTGLALRIGATDETLVFTGALQTADFSPSLAYGGQSNSGWHLLGNPYAATLDWKAMGDNLRFNGLESGGTIYLFDANAKYTGVYGSYNPSTNTGVGATKDIASGQAFFVQADNFGFSSVLFTCGIHHSCRCPIFPN